MRLLDRVPELLPGKPAPYFHGGNGRRLLLLHPGGTSWQVWVPLLAGLTAHREVLALTLPGHIGGAPFPAGGSNLFTDLAAEAERQLDEFDWDRVDIVGNSIGGGAALELARRGRARRVVAISPMGMQDDRQNNRLARGIGRAHATARSTLPLTLAAVSVPALRQRLLAELVQHGERVSAGLARHILHAYTWCDATGFIGTIGAAYSTFQRPEEVTVPTLLIWGDEDRTAPRDNMDRYLAALPDARLVALPDAGHFAHLDEPQRVTDLILEFTR